MVKPSKETTRGLGIDVPKTAQMLRILGLLGDGGPVNVSMLRGGVGLPASDFLVHYRLLDVLCANFVEENMVMSLFYKVLYIHSP